MYLDSFEKVVFQYDFTLWPDELLKFVNDRVSKPPDQKGIWAQDSEMC